MTAEVFHYDIRDEVRPSCLDHEVVESGIYRPIGHGDGTGHETFVIAAKEKVQIFSGFIIGKTTLETSDERGSIRIVQHIADLGVGETHVEPLYGPANNNKTMMLVRNLGDPERKPVTN